MEPLEFMEEINKETLHKIDNNTIESLIKQRSSYDAMIAAEEDKKKPDDNAIKEYEAEIKKIDKIIRNKSKEKENKDQLQASKQNIPHRDSNIKPCFDVEKIAEVFVKQIDSISNSISNNVCMVGIFAPWGRGKSYFFKKIKDIIEEKKGSITFCMGSVKKFLFLHNE